jgi:hypothetical protein
MKSGAPNQLVAGLKKLGDRPEPLRVPDVVFGFRVTKPEGVAPALKRIEALFPKRFPAPQNTAEWRKVGNQDYLVLTFDTKEIFWENLPLFAQAQQGELDGLMKKLKQLKPMVSLGLRDNYLLVAFGESTAVLETLGKGKPVFERPEFQPLGPYAEKRLTNVAYYSQAFREGTGFSKKDVEQWGADAKSYLDNDLVKLLIKPEIKTRIENLINTVIKDIQATVPDPAASMAFSFLNGRGFESYTWDWTPNLSQDGKQPLTLLNHVGGDPLLVSVSRSRYRPENYQNFVKWVKEAHGLFEDVAIPFMPQNMQDEYRRTFNKLKPLLPRVDTATSQLLEALKDGQSAWVVDAKLTSKSWFPGMPPAEKELPIVEPALVLGVSDAALLRKAGAEYMAIATQFTKSMQEIQEGFPSVPPVESASVNGGEVFFWKMPPLPGLDTRLQPNLGLSNNVMTLALSREHSSRLLTATPFREGLLKTDRPLASAFYVNWAGTVDTAMPWIEYGLKRAPMGGGEENLRQVRDVAELLKVLRTYSSITYFEQKGGALAEVTHAETVFQDAP